MKDLSQQVKEKANLVPSSMSAGGEVHPNDLAMTAPGSPPISAPSEQQPGQAPESLPLPSDSDTQQLPVSNAPNKPTAVKAEWVTKWAQASRPGGSPWKGAGNG